jgi:hypothetical protein
MESTSLRARLADALTEALRNNVPLAEHVADVLLSLPDIAVVEPLDRNTVAAVAKAIKEADKWFICTDPRYFNRMARAALLAAANAAEQEIK